MTITGFRQTDNRLCVVLSVTSIIGDIRSETISRWPSVRAGEDKWIFPYQENAT
jgi:uridine kinase